MNSADSLEAKKGSTLLSENSKPLFSASCLQCPRNKQLCLHRSRAEQEDVLRRGAAHLTSCVGSLEEERVEPLQFARNLQIKLIKD